ATAVFLLFASAKLSPVPLVSAVFFSGQGSLFPIYTAVNIALGCILLFHNRIAAKLENSTATTTYAAIVPSAEFRIFGIVLIILTPSFFLLPRPAELNEIAYSILMLMYGLFLRRTSAERTPANT
ncbi:MAG TPA: hypothetical protein PLL10_08750, partial [Elusimicrobiales bacterium]|nr:hypothetical protein [Elusimicrobiales bacterium]